MNAIYNTGKTFYGHYILLIIFFLLDGYSRYFRLVPFTDMASYLLITAGFSFLLLLVFTRLLKNPLKGGVFTTVLLSIWLFYGTIQDFLLTVPIIWFLAAHRFLSASLLILCILVYVTLIKTNRKFNRTTFYINTTLVIFIAIALFEITLKLATRNKTKYLFNSERFTRSCKDCPTPDIYLILLDEYSGSNVLKQHFKYDNSYFENQLKSRGFFVPANSKSNYSSTPISMASTFDMNYFGWEKNKNELQAYALAAKSIPESDAIQTLESFGYSLYNHSIFDLKNLPSAFQTGFLHTKLKLITAKTFPARIRRDFFWRVQLRNKQVPFLKRINETLDEGNERMITLTKSHASKNDVRPSFVYTHLMMPHRPYFFDSTGKRNHFEPVTDEEDRSAYLQYLVFANKKVINLVDEILAKRKQEVVIILLSDHGYRDLPGAVKCEYINSNFSAIHIRDRNYDHYYDSISNVNQFRVLFNTLFSQQLKILPDSCVY